MRLRFKITKEGGARFISHLDYMRAIERALRRAKLPVAWTEGFNPHIRLSLASALGLGIKSLSEYAEVELSAPLDAAQAKERLNRALPPGIRALDADVVNTAPRLTALLAGAAYTVSIKYHDMPALKKAIADYNGREELIYDKKTAPAKPPKRINLKEYIPHVEFSHHGDKASLSFSCRITPGGTVKARDLPDALNECFSLALDSVTADIQRTNLYGKNKEPLIGAG